MQRMLLQVTLFYPLNGEICTRDYKTVDFLTLHLPTAAIGLFSLASDPPHLPDDNLSVLVAGSCRFLKAFGPARVHEISGM